MTDPDPRILCHCFHVSEEEVCDAVESEGLSQVSEVIACTRAGGGCFSCWPEIEAILGTGSTTTVEEIWGPGPQEKLQKRIQEFLDSEFSRLFTLNGIRATLLDVERERVLIQFDGPWEGTPPFSFEAIRNFLRERVSVFLGRKIEICEGFLGLDEDSGLPTL